MSCRPPNSTCTTRTTCRGNHREDPRCILVRHARFSRDMLATSLRGRDGDATRKLLPWNFSLNSPRMQQTRRCGRTEEEREDLLTWRTAHRQVLEVASFDDLHRQAAGGAVVGESEEQFRRAAVHHRLARRTAVTSRHARQARLRLAVLKRSHDHPPTTTYQSIQSNVTLI